MSPWSAVGRCFALGLLASGCSAYHAHPLPSPVSRAPTPVGEFRAGVARVDITPPPGVGLAGGGLESRRSTGYRTRLYASALVMSDSSGERIALVVMDLPHVSANLHRLAAARLAERIGLGADRLIVSASHTHSGPGHFYGERQYNASASRVTGYDPRMTDMLVSRITDAVERAAAAAGPAVAAWGTTEVSGAAWNRALASYCRNGEAVAEPACASGDSALAVERTLFMLRVDGIAGAGRDTVPLGSYSVFALHGTAIPTLNTLLDGDVQVRVVRLLATQADSAGRHSTVHLFANGAEGDAAPAVTREQCDLPRPGLFDAVPMPRGPGGLVDFIEPGRRQVRHCVEHAVGEADRLAAVVAAPASALYDRLRHRLHVVGGIRRVFTTEWLPGRDGLCGSAEVGSSTAAGAKGFETRVRDWRWLLWPILPLGLEEGGTAVDRGSKGCQAPKLIMLQPLQSLVIVGEHGFPETAQLTVVRLDSLLLAAVPAEVTTTAGRRMRARMVQAARDAGRPVAGAVLVGLANGFLQYVTTAEEYGAQHYEGGSVLYGPGTAGLLERRLGELAARLSRADAASPWVEVGPIIAYPGAERSLMPLPGAEPGSPIRGPIGLVCADGRLSGRWLDLPPGRVLPRESPWVVLEKAEAAGTWSRLAADGDGALEITTVRSHGTSGFEWRADWRRIAEPGRYRLMRLADSAGLDRSSDPVACP